MDRRRVAMSTAHPAEHEPEPVLIYVNRREVEIPGPSTTGAAIKAAADVPPDFKLFDPHGNEIEDNTPVHVHSHERFTAISGQDVS
jgi:hypothetical protein